MSEIKVNLRYGPNNYELTVDGEATVKDLYNEFKRPFNLPSSEECKPQIDGQDYPWDSKVTENSTVVFHKTTGKKG